MTEFIWANIENKDAKQYLDNTFPNWQKPPKFTPETMVPQLNRMGENGWELMHMEPIAAVGNNADVGFSRGGQAPGYAWSNVYFCVFKRKKP